jgi:hypothetical protein
LPDAASPERSCEKTTSVNGLFSLLWCRGFAQALLEKRNGLIVKESMKCHAIEARGYGDSAGLSPQLVGPIRFDETGARFRGCWIASLCSQ